VNVNNSADILLSCQQMGHSGLNKISTRNRQE